jgi:hypothetical protein
MLTTKSRPFVSGALLDAVPTSVDVASPILHRDGPEFAAYQAWQRVIDHQLSEWGRDPGQLEDDGLDPPSPEIIQRSIDLSGVFKNWAIRLPPVFTPIQKAGLYLNVATRTSLRSFISGKMGRLITVVFKAQPWLSVGPCNSADSTLYANKNRLRIRVGNPPKMPCRCASREGLDHGQVHVDLAQYARNLAEAVA